MLTSAEPENFQSQSTSLAFLSERPKMQLVRLIFWLTVVVAGFLQAWAARFYISPDGNSYLDVATAYLKGDWQAAINAYWSPMFSWLLASCLWLLRINSYWESTLEHLVNWFGLIAAALCFEFFFRGFLQSRQDPPSAAQKDADLSQVEWWMLGYGIFLSTSLLVVSLVLTTPDIWVCALTYLAAGLVLRIYLSRGNWFYFGALGLVLGCAYLTKSFYFPLSFVFLGVAWLATGNLRKNSPQAILALVVFMAVAGPFVLALSLAKHRFTFGDTGKLAYVMMVGDVAQPQFWHGESGTGAPVHPTRQILDIPRIYEFGAPVSGSYPPYYDLSYWMEGAKAQFHLKGQLRILRQSAGTFFLILMSQVEVFVALLVVVFLARKPGDLLFSLARDWFLWLPAALGCLAYALVLVEPRYVAPFLPLLWLAAFSSAFKSVSEKSPRIGMAIILAILSVMGVKLAKSISSDAIALASHEVNSNWEVARGLRDLGIAPGDKVAGLSRVAEAHWARLAGVTIVAEVPLGQENIFWTSGPKLQDLVLEKLASTGAKAVVTKDPPSGLTDGWVQLHGTVYYAHLLRGGLPALK
jgi:4-amino-4-deoxy-L-arabinose transferase-like glycosyltransferase